VLFSMGGNDGGFVFFVKEGRLTCGYNYVADSYFRVASSGPVPAGRHGLSFQFEPTGPADPASGKGCPARIQLLVDVTGELVEDSEAMIRISLARQ
jgi:arylsulfatase